jgi:hypothetical protein
MTGVPPFAASLLATSVVVGFVGCGSRTSSLEDSLASDASSSPGPAMGCDPEEGPPPTGGGDPSAAPCPVPPLAGAVPPAWTNPGPPCSSSTCPAGTVCVEEHNLWAVPGSAAAVVGQGCAPVPAVCQGAASCGCMGCVCGSASCSQTQMGGATDLVCTIGDAACREGAPCQGGPTETCTMTGQGPCFSDVVLVCAQTHGQWVFQVRSFPCGPGAESCSWAAATGVLGSAPTSTCAESCSCQCGLMVCTGNCPDAGTGLPSP